MPIPATLADLDPTPANNSPLGSEPPFPNLDDYLRAHASILAMLRDREDARWPVGSIYINASSSANPGSFLPGTWQQITSGVLYAQGAPDSGAVGTTGGASTVTLVQEQMPVHTHSMAGAGGHAHTGTANYAGDHAHGISNGIPMPQDGAWSYRGAGTSTEVMSSTAGGHTHSLAINAVGDHAHTIYSAGSGAPHENKMPFLTVYMWKRVS